MNSTLQNSIPNPQGPTKNVEVSSSASRLAGCSPGGFSSSDFLNIFYSFSERTVKYHSDGTASTICHLGLDRYMSGKHHEKHTIMSIQRHTRKGPLTRAGVIDIDCHSEDTQDAARTKYDMLGEALTAAGIKWIGAISSKRHGLIRGYHIYLLFSRPQNSEYLHHVLAEFVSAHVQNDHIDIFPMAKAIRPFFVDRGDGSEPGELLHGNLDLNDGFSALVQPKREESKTPWLDIVEEIKTEHPEFQTMEPRESIKKFHTQVVKKAKNRGWALCAMSDVMVMYMFGIDKEAAKARIRRFRSAYNIIPFLRGKAGAYFYSTTGTPKNKYYLQGTLKSWIFRAGERNKTIGAIVWYLKRSGASLKEVLRVSERVFIETYRGATSLETHLAETIRWYNAARVSA